MKEANTLNDKTRYEEFVKSRIRIQGDDAHHLEPVATHHGVTWINHSMSTTIELTWYALRDVDGPVLLVIGGVDRSDDHARLTQLIAEKVHTIICLGSTPWKYFNAWRNAATLIVQAKNMAEAVDYAGVLARNEIKTVLFAPSCPSYDAFDNYRNRGDHFRKLVLGKINGKSK
jgi:UDP-N-acetylmuramoylalanine--D-glutamate ligase